MLAGQYDEASRCRLYLPVRGRESTAGGARRVGVSGRIRPAPALTTPRSPRDRRFGDSRYPVAVGSLWPPSSSELSRDFQSDTANRITLATVLVGFPMGTTELAVPQWLGCKWRLDASSRKPLRSKQVKCEWRVRWRGDRDPGTSFEESRLEESGTAARHMASLEKPNDQYPAYVRDLPDCVVAGDTPAEAQSLVRAGVFDRCGSLRASGDPMAVPPGLLSPIRVGVLRP